MKTFVAVLTSILLVFVCLVVLAQAEVVGRITQVEGRVDFLKGGKLPASAAKLDDGVEVGDVLRTKSLSKAQITFMDNTVITISPESRIAVEEYMFDPGQGKRSAVLQLFQGLAHVVVSKLFKPAEPDFVVKTQTAVMGVRGTEVGLRIHPNNTTILTFEGHTEVGNIFPEVGDLLFKKAYKIAFSWGHSTVHLHNMQGTSVFRGLPPTQPFTITQQDRQQFMGQMSSGLTSQKGTKDGAQAAAGGSSGSGSSSGSSGSGTGSGATGGGTDTSGSGASSLTTASLGGPDSGLGSTSTLSTLPTAITTTTTNGVAGTGLTANQVITNTIVTPTVTPAGTTTPTPPPPPPPPPTLNFSETFSGPFALTSVSPNTVGNFATTSPATGTRTGVNPGPFTANYNFSAIWNNPANTWNPSYNGTFTGTINGSTITGTMDVTLLDTVGGSFTGTGVPFTVDPSGILRFSLAGFTGVAFPQNDPMTVTSGTFTQTPATTPPPTSTTYSFTQTGYTTFQSTAAADGRSNTITTTGWGQRTGTSTAAGTQPLPDSYGGYFSSSSTGSRTLTQGALLGNGSGTSFSTLTGTVSGVLGSTLTGTGTVTGTSSFGETTNYTGTVTIDATGRLTFTYANGTISSLGRLLSASGTMTDTPGTYFTQTLNGATLSSSSDPYNTASLTSLGTGGSRSGVLPGNFGLAFTNGTKTSPWTFSYLPNELSDVNASMQGVVSGPPGSTLTGAMTIFPSNPDSGYPSYLVSSLQPSSYLFPRTEINETIVSSINIQPNGSATGTVYDTYFQDGKFTTSTFDLTQTPLTSGVYTPTSATYNFTQTYNGALMVGNSMSLVSAGDTGVSGFGWGLRSGTGTTGGVTGGAVLNYNGYFGAYDNGVWTGAASALPSNYNGSGLNTGISGPGSVTQMAGSVSGALGQPLTGSMTWVGSLINGPSFSYSGPVTIDSNGSLKFTYGNGTYASGGAYSSNWTYGTGLSGTASGTLYEYPGYYFTQTMTGNNYQFNPNSPSSGTLTVSNSTSAGGSRSGVYGGNIGPFSGSFNVWSTSTLPSSLSGPSGTGVSGNSVSLTLDGVVDTSVLGATSGPASLQISSPDFPGLSMTVPGMVGLSPGNTSLAGGTYFTAPGVFVQNNLGTPLAVGSFSSSSTLPSALAQTPLYYFSESYQGFRLSTLGAASNLTNIEGYGFGVRGSSVDNPAGAAALPSNYLGAFLAQDLGTRASTTALSSNMASLSGSLSATLSGTLGQTLTGQGLFTGTTSAGVAFSYQGNVTLAANGQLVFNYGGNWNSTTSSQTGTGSGMIQQIPGTSFTETVTGTAQLASTSTPLGTNYPTGTNLTVATVQDATSLTGSRTVGSTTSSTTGSIAGMLATVNTPAAAASTAPVTVTVQGVVAGPSYQTQWGVAGLTASAGTTTPGVAVVGPVTIDTSGTLTGQFVDTQNNSSGPANPANNLSVNYASVPASSGLTTASFTQTASGTFNATANNTQSVVTVTAPTLTGTSTGVLAGPINSNLAITSTALQPNAYASGTGTIAATTVGVVAGPVGGTQTGVSTVQAVKTGTGGSTTPTTYVGTTTLTPAVAPAVSPVLTTTLQGVNPATVPGVGSVGATQTGTLTVTK